jgi:ABC-type glycerol-3-phosphate transport system substrate-binding protein
MSRNRRNLAAALLLAAIVGACGSGGATAAPTAGQTANAVTSINPGGPTAAPTAGR